MKKPVVEGAESDQVFRLIASTLAAWFDVMQL
jgi:hypothetical protein